MDDKLEIGSSLGHYRIVSKIGSGGMGEVYLAADTKLDRQVALKILQTDAAADANRVRRFVQEAKSASALNHPNIITVHEIGTFDGSHYIATELIKGETLRDRLQRGSPTLREILEIASQAAAALNAAHDAGIVHRDIKPENIMIRDDGLVKVLDFGLVKLTEKMEPAAVSNDPTRPYLKTEPGTIMGTALYMSPEQARGKETDARTDIWSLGIVLFEMLTGKTPFAGETTNDSIAAILTKEPPALLESVPLELQRIIKKTLQKKADERYQTVKDLLLDLKNLKRELEFSEELERSHIPAFSKSANVGVTQPGENATKAHAAAVSTQNSLAYQASSAEYLVTTAGKHKFTAFSVLGILLAVLLGAGFYFWYSATDSNAITSVAVLPFENGSGDATLDYLSDGLSESLIDKLSQLPQLKVIARNSSFKYRGANIDLQDVANKLGVQAIVMGKVVRVGDNLTVRVEMIDARDDRQLWSEQYNRKASDMLAVQQEIAHAASEKLRLKLSGDQEQRLAEVATVNPLAYELLLKGRYYLNTRGEGNWNKAIEHFNQAIAVDPNYALAYAELSQRYRLNIANSLSDPKEFGPKATAAARKALELDDNLAEAHLAMAGLHRDAWDWAAAEAEYKRAIELNANLGVAHRGYSGYLSNIGRSDEAIAEAKRGKELDPLSVASSVGVALSFYHARRYDEAIESSQKTLELDKSWGYTLLGYAYAGKGMYKEAVASYEESIRIGNPSPSVHIYLGAAYARAGAREKARAELKKLETSKEYVSPGELATLYTALDDKEAAFQSLEKGFAEHDLQLQYLKADSSFDPLRSDPRFADLLRRVGLPE